MSINTDPFYNIDPFVIFFFYNSHLFLCNVFTSNKKINLCCNIGVVFINCKVSHSKLDLRPKYTYLVMTLLIKTFKCFLIFTSKMRKWPKRMGEKVKLLSVFIAFPVCMHCYLRLSQKTWSTTRHYFIKTNILMVKTLIMKYFI